jgi:hypothetical protein
MKPDTVCRNRCQQTASDKVRSNTPFCGKSCCSLATMLSLCLKSGQSAPHCALHSATHRIATMHKSSTGRLLPHFSGGKDTNTKPSTLSNCNVAAPQLLPTWCQIACRAHTIKIDVQRIFSPLVCGFPAHCHPACRDARHKAAKQTHRCLSARAESTHGHGLEHPGQLTCMASFIHHHEKLLGCFSRHAPQLSQAAGRFWDDAAADKCDGAQLWKLLPTQKLTQRSVCFSQSWTYVTTP